ncbi:MAG: NAD(P)-dependent oxidoreductase [Myxococcota bacterium]|nr:NAD(P)-dependent oxidoreductase [Myxococcota bacterium]
MSGVRAPALVTGAGGFIGRRVVARLLADGVETRALLLPDEAAPGDWGDRVRIERGDVRDPEAVREAVRGTGTVFHLAALVAEAGDDYAAHWAVTAEGSRNVYAAAAAARARVVVTTSICAYGDRIQRDVCREDSERGAYQGPYGRAKQAQEDLALEAHERDGLAVSIVRPANVYGVGSRPWVDLLGEAIRAGAIAVLGDGSGNAGLVHVDNLVDALMRVAASDAAIGRTYNVCDGLDVTWRQYMDDLARLQGVAGPGTVPREPLLEAARANEDPPALVGPRDAAIPPLEMLNLVGSDNRFDTTRIREELGWAPRVGYDQALEEIGAYLAET